MYPDPGHLLRLLEVVSLLQDCRQHCMCLQDGTERRALLDLIERLIESVGREMDDVRGY